MTNVPVEFRTFDIVNNDTLHLSYAFDVVNRIEVTTSSLPIKQDVPLTALQLNLSGKTANPNISVAIDGKTHLFTLNTAYITDIYPHLKDTVTDAAFVIEGYSIENVTKERVLLFLPMTKTADTTNVFYPLEQAILNKNPLKGVTFNDYIPNTKLERDYYTYYHHTDNDGTLYHILYFQKSPLQYTVALKIPENKKGYTSTYKATNYKTTTLAKLHDNMTTQFEDNIYIDCVPIELENQKVEKYMKTNQDLGKYLNEIIMYVVYIVILTLVVYGIYTVQQYISPSVKT